MKPYYQDASVTIYHGDCREIMPALPKADLIVADPPYHGVVAEDWDNQWATDGDFLSWVSDVAKIIDGRMSDSGTLYLFASPRMAARVEVSLAQFFNVISHAVWSKGQARQGAAGSGVDVSALRTYWTSTNERAIVAEKRINQAFDSADSLARERSGYWSACEKAKASIFGDYLRAEFTRAGVSNSDVAELFPSKTGRKTGCVSNWLLGSNIPTAEQYQAIRDFLNASTGGTYLERGYEEMRNGYEEMRKGYEEMRKGYEEMRKGYEEMRRPFNIDPHDQWGQIWEFPIERDRQHPTQKPLPLISQIVRISSRIGQTVLDPFMGSGTTLRAAKDLGRRAIGIEMEEKYCEIAAKRMGQEVLSFGAAA